MQAPERAEELERVYQARRGHAPQISISDDSHHVTEAIGDMYGDSNYTRRDSRPWSFIVSPTSESFENSNSYFAAKTQPGSPSEGTTSNGSPKMPTSPRSPLSPPRLNRQSSDMASQKFEFHDIDYESSPAAVAQELSNLQAIRRMSMDVNGSDPDLPSFSNNVSIPAVAPTHSADEDDPSRMFWVPARVHPELEPKAFKTFIEEKVHKHRRISGGSDDSLLSPGGLDPQGSNGGLRRKKSMLSKQIDSSSGYRDGAERLERKRSEKEGGAHTPTLQQLESLTEDPSTLVRSLSLRESMDSGVEVPNTEDMPILPVKPGQSLKRSTRTNYRRGSLRKGERVPYNRRLAGKHGVDAESDDSPLTSPIATTAGEVDWPKQGISRVQTDPTPARSDKSENFSRPHRIRSPPPSGQEMPSEEESRAADGYQAGTPEHLPEQTSRKPRAFHSRIASNGRTTAPLPGYTPPPSVPQIVETPPPTETSGSRPPPIPAQHPERKSSMERPTVTTSQSAPPAGYGAPPKIHTPRGSSRSQARQAQAAQAKQPAQTLEDMASHPTAIPGHTSATRTDSLSVIPTFDDGRRSDKEPKDDDDVSEGGPRKTSWGTWFSRREREKAKEEEREKEKKEKEEKEIERKKSKSKLIKSTEKSHDNARLDVLQASIEEGRGRESLVLDRSSIKLEEERAKTNSRKTSSEKKEKEGIFSSIFGGSKKKGDRDSGGKKASTQRGLSPDPPPRVLRPDIDYNWTRFSLLEERAIYRMAHIKLANPRRELLSQVLLSNFMYSYLAKVQQMHPNIQIGQNAAQKQQQRLAQEQKKKEEEQRRREQQQQPEEFTQYQQYQAQQAQAEGHDMSVHASDTTSAQYADSSNAQSGGENGIPPRTDSRASQQSHASYSSQHSQQNSRGKTNGYSVASGQSYMGQQSYYSQHGYEEDEDRGGENDMW